MAAHAAPTAKRLFSFMFPSCFGRAREPRTRVASPPENFARRSNEPQVGDPRKTLVKRAVKNEASHAGVIGIAIALVVCWSASLAHAHPLDIGYLRIQQSGARVTVALDLNPDAAALLVGGAKLDAAGL